MKINLETNVQYLKGVGPKLGDLLAKRGINTVRDLIEYYPRAYEDRRAVRQISNLRPDEMVSLRAQVVKVSAIPMGRTQRKMYDVLLRDASGMIHCKYFRVPYRGYFERFTPYKEVRVTGKVINYRGRIEFHHPDIRDIESDDEIKDDLIPIYTEIESLTSMKIMRLIRQAIDQISKDVNAEKNSWEALIEEKFPASLLRKYQLMSRAEALLQLHRPPPELSQLMSEQKSPAHRRIIFEEFFWLELYLAAKKSGLKKEPGIKLRDRFSGNDKSLIAKLQKALPFAMTGAQLRAFADIKNDLQGDHPMNRLVQGDVGCGKTLVAFMSAAFVCENGFQSCLMVPTEILAEQHFAQAKKVLAPLGVRVEILTGKTKASEKKEICERLASGQIDVLVGTHALIEDPVQFKKLALVIIDEQHRFGVEQRGKLKNKGHSPHFLIMTATPIPRTLAMTVYGDLDVSLIDEMPSGRSPIQTRAVFENKRPDALQFMCDQIKKGRQAYIVYPLVEESEKMDLKNAVDEFAKLQLQFPKLRFGLMHGKMKPSEKDQVMDQFRKAQLDVLVSTTVIEVGVDVPNANIMIIEHAERFGLSQLHQLRGRVGRGEHKSFCILLQGRAVSEEGKARNQMMEQTSDGFKIAEFDLEMRGPGEFLGTRQSGLAGFKMANIVRDILALQDARQAAFDIFNSDPNLKSAENEKLRIELLKAHGAVSLADIA